MGLNRHVAINLRKTGDSTEPKADVPRQVVYYVLEATSLNSGCPFSHEVPDRVVFTPNITAAVDLTGGLHQRRRPGGLCGGNYIDLDLLQSLIELTNSRKYLVMLDLAMRAGWTLEYTMREYAVDPMALIPAVNCVVKMAMMACGAGPLKSRHGLATTTASFQVALDALPHASASAAHLRRWMEHINLNPSADAPGEQDRERLRSRSFRRDTGT